MRISLTGKNLSEYEIWRKHGKFVNLLPTKRHKQKHNKNEKIDYWSGTYQPFDKLCSKTKQAFMKKLALVTGGSAGIGLAVAKELLRRDYAVLLVARHREKLEQAREKLTQAGKTPKPAHEKPGKHQEKQAGACECHCGEKSDTSNDILLYPADLARETAAQEIFDYVKKQGLQVDVLVNNAGSYFFREATAISTSDTEKLIYLNILTLTQLCQLFGGDMASRGSGYILNLSSYSVYMKWPGWSLYSGSKSFVRNFSITFAREMRHLGVAVTCAAPTGVATDLMGLPENIIRLGLSLGILMKPETCARQIVRALFNKREYIVPGAFHVVWIPFVEAFGKLFPRQIHHLTKKILPS